MVLTQHNTFIDYNDVWNTVEKLNDFAIGTESLKEADKIITVSNATKKYVLSLGVDPNKVQVLYNGVDLDRFKPIKGAREAIRRRLTVAQDAVVVVTVRRLVFKNGVDTLMESARIAIRKNPKLVFLVIGKGPDFNEVKTKIAQWGLIRSFRLAGFVSDEELPLYYNAADFFVLPSKSGEGLPLVALEAMACGLPLIATDVGGIREIMIKDYGKIVPPNDPQSMAEAVLMFSEIDFEEQRKDLRKIVEQRFSWDGNVERLIHLYEELI